MEGSFYDNAGRAAVAALFLAVLSATAADATPESEIIKGISYGPFPAKQHVFPPGGHLIDDFMSDYAKPLWGTRGRGDLETMKKMGANTVRLYGNNPEEQHGGFLDEAERLGLKVIPGNSDFPYTQASDSCKNKNYDCYDIIRESYKQNLQNGFLKNGEYHPALHSMIVINEPELKLGNYGNQVHPDIFIKAILSAIDGMLSAENDMNVRGTKISFTVTSSYGLCGLCQVSPPGPGLSQMLELQKGISNPEAYGYHPRNDLKSLYDTRFYNSFNTANSATDLQIQFFTPYAMAFPNKKVAVLEFHQPGAPPRPPVDNSQDLSNMMDMSRSSQQLIGFSFFEWQVRYDKGGAEEAFGMFGLGDLRITTLEYYGYTYNVWCLVPIVDRVTQRKIPEEITEVFQGEGLNYFTLCQPDASKVPLDSEGFNQIRGSVDDKATFIARMVEGLGGKVVDEGKLKAFANGVSDFNALKQTLQNRQGTTWASWDPNAACVADRAAGTAAIGSAVSAACKLGFDCKKIPKDCAVHFWENADYVLSASYHYRPDITNSDGTLRAIFDDCYYNGAAKFAAPSYYQPKDSKCVVTTDPSTTTLTDPGYQAILKLNNADDLATFFERVVKEDLHGSVSDHDALNKFAASILANERDGTGYTMAKFTDFELPNKPWVCGGNLDRVCHYNPGSPLSGSLSWVPYAFAGMGALILLGIVCTVVYVRMGKSAKGMERQMCPCLPKSCREDSDSDSD